MAFDYKKFSKAYAVLNAQKNEIDEKMKVLKKKIQEHVDLESDRKVTTPYATMGFKSAYTKTSVDLKEIKTKDPELYATLESRGYIKTSVVNETFEIKCKAVLLE